MTEHRRCTRRCFKRHKREIFIDVFGLLSFCCVIISEKNCRFYQIFFSVVKKISKKGFYGYFHTPLEVLIVFFLSLLLTWWSMSFRFDRQCEYFSECCITAWPHRRCLFCPNSTTIRNSSWISVFLLCQVCFTFHNWKQWHICCQKSTQSFGNVLWTK